MTNSNILRRASENSGRGLEWFEERIPEWLVMTTRSLATRSDKRCPLSQATGLPFDEALAKYQLSLDDAVKLGFFVKGTDQTSDLVAREYEYLDHFFREGRNKRIREMGLMHYFSVGEVNPMTDCA